MSKKFRTIHLIPKQFTIFNTSYTSYFDTSGSLITLTREEIEVKDDEPYDQYISSKISLEDLQKELETIESSKYDIIINVDRSSKWNILESDSSWMCQSNGKIYFYYYNYREWIDVIEFTSDHVKKYAEEDFNLNLTSAKFIDFIYDKTTIFISLQKNQMIVKNDQSYVYFNYPIIDFEEDRTVDIKTLFSGTKQSQFVFPTRMFLQLIKRTSRSQNDYVNLKISENSDQLVIKYRFDELTLVTSIKQMCDVSTPFNFFLRPDILKELLTNHAKKTTFTLFNLHSKNYIMFTTKNLKSLLIIHPPRE